MTNKAGERPTIAQADIEKLPVKNDRGASYVHMRIDCARNTRAIVTRNVQKHIHITLGQDATLILHPHMANRLIIAMQAVLEGKDFSA